MEPKNSRHNGVKDLDDFVADKKSFDPVCAQALIRWVYIPHQGTDRKLYDHNALCLAKLEPDNTW
ncbi:216ae378-bf5d-43d2-93ab-481a20336f68-CDS [Sclerotinia trifoliorum]|uniref:216ae378-bf5d-43d2-93ab-481a20336f68-CDS n=1 Tax=Sclerotinia trifoliorum TaxID=28548 RepID=A0A8H2VV19_9HELO|nr:216ae378-bf5d-43d2-93ab-481a20336f68-CDS [Sclerotinia trifoliorum]